MKQVDGIQIMFNPRQLLSPRLTSHNHLEQKILFSRFFGVRERKEKKQYKNVNIKMSF